MEIAMQSKQKFRKVAEVHLFPRFQFMDLHSLESILARYCDNECVRDIAAAHVFRRGKQATVRMLVLTNYALRLVEQVPGRTLGR